MEYNFNLDFLGGSLYARQNLGVAEKDFAELLLLLNKAMKKKKNASSR